MIPLKLELKNFLSYGDRVQTISFEPYSFICLSGKNGHGKSALLDAMTWAVWGQARKIFGAQKADEGLLRLGQSRMLVSFEFVSGGSKYRVRREFYKNHGRVYLVLDCELYDMSREKFISLTEKTVKLTQEKIEKFVGLDYETFINSVFLRQGQSHEFSKKNPKERKEILANILGLGSYDLLQQKALERVRACSQKLYALKLVQEKSIEECACEEKLNEEKENLNIKINTLTQELNKLSETENSLNNFLSDLKSREQEYARLNKEYLNKSDQYTKGVELLSGEVLLWRNTQKDLKNIPDITSIEKERAFLLEKIHKRLECEQKDVSLRSDVIVLQGCISQRRAVLAQVYQEEIFKARTESERLSSTFAQYSRDKDQKEKELQVCEQEILKCEQDLCEFKIKKESLEKLCVNLEKDLFKCEKYKKYYQKWSEQERWVAAQCEELKGKRKTLEETVSPACPLCEQLLTQKRKLFLSSKILAQEKFFLHRHKRLIYLVKKLKEFLEKFLSYTEKFKKIREDIAQCELSLVYTEKTLKEFTQKRELLIKEINSLLKLFQDTQKECAVLLKIYEEIKLASQQKIENDPEIVSLYLRISEITKEREALLKIREEFSVLDFQVSVCEEKYKKTLKLLEESKRQVARRAAITQMILNLKLCKRERDDLETQCLAYKFNPEDQRECLTKRQECVFKKDQIKGALEEIKNNFLKCEHELSRIDKLKEENKKREQEIISLKEDQEDFEVLAQAYGKNGVQALLIENAIPEIENEANILLSRLTNNQAQIFIESLRDLKSGGTKETLDISISDNMGIRPYEMYSGGESFRIDFALRIAISKLLARRAGTSLQTLIIDEGFGSQDEEGISKILDALYVIQKDFSKIIVVSHMSDFKENFPVHFIVQKLATGSVVNICERG
jgi:exonuclease SbcC